jgi:hypothetical protein
MRPLLLTFIALAVAAPPAVAGPTDPPRDAARAYEAAGGRFGVSPRLLAAIGFAESRHGRAELPGVTSGINRAGCCAGPAQLCVVRSCGRVWQRYRVDGDGNGRFRVHDVDDAFATAARYVLVLRKLIRSKRLRLVLAAYNAGPGAVRRYGGVPPYAETQNYVRTALRAWRRSSTRSDAASIPQLSRTRSAGTAAAEPSTD